MSDKDKEEEIGRSNREILTAKVITVLLLMIQIFNVLMASLLLVFVPQQCGSEACGITQSFESLTRIGVIGMVLNFIALAANLTHEIFVWRREMWMNNHFDDDDTYTDENLGKTLKIHPIIDEEFQRHNKKVIVSSILCIFINALNVVISAFVLFGYRYENTRTTTTYITYMLLLVNIFKGVVMNAYKGLKEGRGYSNIETEPFEWNMIHKNFCTGGQAEDNERKAPNQEQQGQGQPTSSEISMV